MKLRPASRNELRLMLWSTTLFALLQLFLFYVFSCFGLGSFSPALLLSTLLGTLVANSNFYLLCRTVERAVTLKEEPHRRRFFQRSYTLRLLFQCGWVVFSFSTPALHPLAGALPLFYPSLTLLLPRLIPRLAHVAPPLHPRLTPGSPPKNPEKTR